MRHQLLGAAAIERALASGTEIALVLVRESWESEESAALLNALADRGVAIRFESERELRRMSPESSSPEMIAVVGRPLDSAASLADVMAGPEIVFILAGLRYPANVGFILRSVEVAGGAAVIVDADWESGQFEEALRISMRADRFYPVLRAPATRAVAAAHEAGRRVLAVETSGDAMPWETDLRSPCAIVVGSETTGIAPAVLASADARVRIPVAGFIPSYNVQAAVGILLGEWLRQTTTEADR